MDSLTIKELQKALHGALFDPDVIQKNGGHRNLDILGMDACYMAMGEVAYQVRESVDILIGAEGLEAEFGWPYRRILGSAKEYHANHPGERITQ